MYASSQWNYDKLIVLQKKTSDKEEPSQEELISYAEHLGLSQHQIRNKKMFRLVYEAFQTELPDQWEACATSKSLQTIVYRNKITKQIKEEHPIDEVYRYKIIQLREALESGQIPSNSQSDASVVQQQLFEIAEDENQLKNQSEIYEKNRYGQLQNNKSHLRQALNSQNFKRILEAENYSVSVNSALNQRIPSVKGKQSISQDRYTQKILPSSLLLPAQSSQQPRNQRYLTILTNLDNDSANDTSKNDEKNVSVKQVVQMLRAELLQLEKQQEVKRGLLEQLQISNQQKMQKIRRKLTKKKDKARQVKSPYTQY